MPYFFPRGSGPLISVLLPTRGRPGDLCRAIDSCHSLADNQSHLEYILKIDDDDTETLSLAEKLSKTLPLRFIVSPRHAGYPLMHTWVNEMAAIAKGDWLFLFNDDALIKTEKWDYQVLITATSRPWCGVTELCLLLTPTIDRPFAQEFFLLRKRTYEILGHVSLSPHNDTWIYGIMNFLGMIMSLPIAIEHNSHLMKDDTRIQSEEAYKTTIQSIISPAAKRLRMRDLEVLLSYQEGVQNSRVWLSAPINGWNWFRDAQGKEKCCVVEQDKAMLLGINETNEVRSWEELKGQWCPLV